MNDFYIGRFDLLENDVDQEIYKLLDIKLFYFDNLFMQYVDEE